MACPMWLVKRSQILEIEFSDNHSGDSLIILYI